MRDYAMVSPTFWTGKTGKRIRKLGPEAQVVALYLLTSPHSNLAGLYYLPLAYVMHETGLGEGAVEAAVEALEGEGFCHYDHDAEVVWVVEMAHYQIGDSMPAPVEGKKEDSRRVKLKKVLSKHRKCVFYPAFLDRYADPYHLHDLRGVDGVSTGRERTDSTPRRTPRLPVPAPVPDPGGVQGGAGSFADADPARDGMPITDGTVVASCPQCGSPVVAKPSQFGGMWAPCTNRSCEFKIPKLSGGVLKPPEPQPDLEAAELAIRDRMGRGLA